MPAAHATASSSAYAPLNKQLLLGIGLFALAVRLAVVALHVAAPDVAAEHDANSELIWISRNLAVGRGFASPFDVGEAPSAWLAPFVPTLWALLMKGFGEGRLFLAAALGLNALASAGAVVLYVATLPQLLRDARVLSRGALIAAGVLLGLWPLSLRLVTLTWYYAWQELALAALFFGLLRWAHTNFARRWTLWVMLAGIGAVYINPSPLVLLPPACLSLLWWGRDSWIRRAAAMAAVAAAILVAMLPWVVRCHAELGRWMPMRSSFGVELRQGNNPQGVVHQTSASLHPALVPAERAAFDRLGEGRYTADALTSAVDYMRNHPKETLRRTCLRAYLFWCSDIFDQWPWQERAPWWQGSPATWGRGLLKIAVYLLPLVAALVTALAGWWRNLQGRWLLAALLLVYPIPYYLTHVSSEYAYPVQPYLILYAFAAVLTHWGARTPVRENG